MERPRRKLTLNDGWDVISASGGIVLAGIFTDIGVASCMYNKLAVLKCTYEEINIPNILIFFLKVVCKSTRPTGLEDAGPKLLVVMTVRPHIQTAA